jgi:cytochrome c553
VLAAWLMALAGLACAEPVKDTLEQRLLACAGCHGKSGEGVRANQYYPPIAGKPAGYLFNQLINFRERRRQVQVMNYIVAYLSDEYLREIAEYYAKLPAAPRAQAAMLPSGSLKRGEALMLQGDPARKIPACAACHGKTFNGMEPSIPGLVGLDAQYIGAQMGAWRNGVRRAQEPDCMANIASLLVPGDIESIAAYLASLASSKQGSPLPAGSLKLPMECGGL